MKRYCVVYMVYGSCYYFRCTTKTKSEAKRQCKEYMNVSSKDIIEVYEED